MAVCTDLSSLFPLSQPPPHTHTTSTTTRTLTRRPPEYPQNTDTPRTDCGMKLQRSGKKAGSRLTAALGLLVASGLHTTCAFLSTQSTIPAIPTRTLHTAIHEIISSTKSTNAVQIMPNQQNAGVYLHIPFCRRRCHYCDFPIKVVGEKASMQRSSGEYYTDLLLRDIERWTAHAGEEGRHVDTIYFGGGTPSLLPDQCIERVLDKLKDTFQIDPNAEVTLEMDPGTFDYDRLLRLRQYGVNRISMGVQSFDDAMLKYCGRPHNTQDTNSALDALHKANWDNFSIDLISSLPHLTPELWEESLIRASKCGSSHISVYDLQVEPGTAFARWYKPSTHPLPTEILSADMYRTAVKVLGQAKFEHYEVSNYALSGRRSKHNQKYWQCAPVLAFGMSAASYLQGQRFVRPRDMRKYEEYVESLASWPAQQQVKPATKEFVDRNSATFSPSVHIPDILDFLMLSLRTADGLDLPLFTSRYGENNTIKLLGALKPYVSQGLVLLQDNNRHELILEGLIKGVDDRISKENACCLNGASASIPISDSASWVRLSDPDGLMLSNDIISSVFAALPDDNSEEIN